MNVTVQLNNSARVETTRAPQYRPTFAVGFSRQPLPKGSCFAIVTNADGTSIIATDAVVRFGLELAKLRPETLESFEAKLPPTATLSSSARHEARQTDSFAEGSLAGLNRITNGVKRKLSGGVSFGGENLEFLKVVRATMTRPRGG
jgi:hypothetical protein